MSVLTNLLPGLRDLRAPLSAGFIWLVVIYLAVAPLPADPDGVVGSVDDLRKELGPVAQAAALALVAYILGSFAQAIVSIVAGALGLWRDASRAIDALLAARSAVSAGRIGSLRDEDRRSVAFDAELRDVAQDAARRALGRLETRDVDLLAALDTLEWTRPLAKSVPIRGIYYVDVSGIGSSDDAEHDMAWQGLMHRVEQHKAEAGKALDMDADSFEKAVLASGASHVPWLALFVARLLTERLRQELDQMRTRLLVDQPELFSKVDRLRAEAEFRATVAPALVGLAIVLWAESPWLTAATVFMATVLLIQGMSQGRQSDAALVESLRIGRVSSPSLDQVTALGTDQWIGDFWRSESLSRASVGSSP
jgi:hypothetical protein